MEAEIMAKQRNTEGLSCAGEPGPWPFSEPSDSAIRCIPVAFDGYGSVQISDAEADKCDVSECMQYCDSYGTALTTMRVER